MGGRGLTVREVRRSIRSSGEVLAVDRVAVVLGDVLLDQASLEDVASLRGYRVLGLRRRLFE